MEQVVTARFIIYATPQQRAAFEMACELIEFNNYYRWLPASNGRYWLEWSCVGEPANSVQWDLRHWSQICEIAKPLGLQIVKSFQINHEV